MTQSWDNFNRATIGSNWTAQASTITVYNVDYASAGAFNGCVVFAEGKYHMVYRALSEKKMLNGIEMEVSTVGYAESDDGVHFTGHRQLITPQEDWEKYGCEDPRITYMNRKKD
jgi:predicted GH43/DUF377 family glycosyl hydrolase